MIVEFGTGRVVETKKSIVVEPGPARGNQCAPVARQ
jgi:hypothetical protein